MWQKLEKYPKVVLNKMIVFKTLKFEDVFYCAVMKVTDKKC